MAVLCKFHVYDRQFTKRSSSPKNTKIHTNRHPHTHTVKHSCDTSWSVCGKCRGSQHRRILIYINAYTYIFAISTYICFFFNAFPFLKTLSKDKCLGTGDEGLVNFSFTNILSELKFIYVGIHLELH